MPGAINVDLKNSAIDLLHSWLKQRVLEEGLRWLEKKLEKISGGAPHRHIGKALPQLSTSGACASKISFSSRGRKREKEFYSECSKFKFSTLVGLSKINAPCKYCHCMG
jgi:hypothetical protein